ncbi:Uncharacterized conserved protein UCP031277 [Senna tora]|uniref:Uncharacterized conserved protein UCP031277 n=1 Tax=Senna tora TaxID=362788 RepID=A0A834SFM0_9FABA|nr:Uncharacterized conserved protein UCP031277 [Senna tora]
MERLEGEETADLAEQTTTFGRRRRGSRKGPEGVEMEWEWKARGHKAKAGLDSSFSVYNPCAYIGCLAHICSKVDRACVESVLRVMPLTRFAADAIGVVTICLVAILVILGVLCIVYTFYFRTRIRHQGFVQLDYFCGPWIIRITFILFAIWWGFGEILRLSLISRAFHIKWQQTVCKCQIVSNLGFAEPCLFLTIVFLLRAPLQKVETGIMSQKWNVKTAGRILLYCFPVFVLQLFVILIGPQLDKNKGSGKKLPHYFTSAAATTTTGENEVSICTYPLLSTIVLGLFAIILTFYLFWLGRQILKLVINKGLQKRVYTLIFSVSGFLPLRVLFLGLSVLYRPEQFMFVAFTFLAFLALVCCVGVCICVLVYQPVADSLALGNLQDLEARRGLNVDHNDTMSLIANQSNMEGVEENVGSSASSDATTKRGSISFRTSEKDRTSTGTFVELSLFSPSRNASPPGSPRPLGWPMQPPTQVLGWAGN